MTLNLNWALRAHGQSYQMLLTHSLFPAWQPFYYFDLPKFQHFYTSLHFHRENWNMEGDFTASHGICLQSLPAMDAWMSLLSSVNFLFMASRAPCPLCSLWIAGCSFSDASAGSSSPPVPRNISLPGRLLGCLLYPQLLHLWAHAIVWLKWTNKYKITPKFMAPYQVSY